MWTREQLKTNAKINMHRNYWGCVAVAFIMTVVEGIGAAGSARSGSRRATADSSYSSYSGHHGYGGHHIGNMSGTFTAIASVLVVIGLVLFVFGILLNIFVGNVLRIGANKFFIQNRTEITYVGNIFDGFRSGHYGNVVLTMFLKDLYVALWTLLLIIPGIIKNFEYMMVPYILAENPGMDQKEAFAISKRMMDGEKFDAFIL